MQKRLNTLLAPENRGGNLRPVSGASVTVTDPNGALATIYSDNGVTVAANPLTSSATGDYAYYAADGRYTETIVKAGRDTVTISDILLEDPADSPSPTSADIASTADSKGAGLVGFSALAEYAAGTVGRKLQETVSVKDFGAVGDGVADDTASIAAAEAACEAGQELVWPGGTYRFTSPLTITRQKPRWTAQGKVDLVYAGASATADLITVGDGATEIVNPLIVGDFSLRSTTDMTGGTGLRLRRTVRGAVSLIPQGQDHYQNHGNKLWNGIWFDETDNMACFAQEVCAKNDGIRISGAVGSGPKADLYLNYTKISGCAVGLRMGGAFGGLYTNHITLINNGTNVVFDQSLAAEGNREAFFVGGAVDVTTSGPGIYFNDAGGLLTQFTGLWIASAASHGVHVSTYGGKATFDGCRVFNCGGDAYKIDTANPYVAIHGGQIHDNDGYGINPTVSAHKVSWGGVQLAANASGNINTTFESAVKTTFGPMAAKNITADQVAVDSTFYQQLVSGNPTFNADANDYVQFDRAQNQWNFYVGGVLAFKIRSTGNIAFGGTGGGDTRLSVAGSATGSATSYGTRVNPQVQSDVTTTYFNNMSEPSTAATAFTLANLNHYAAYQGTIGAGSAITNQTGFRTDSSLTGATNNYGFYGGISAGAGRWNFYAPGTARNYFAGGVEVAAGTTGMTAGFMHVPAAAGAPSGIPSNIPTGNVPLYYDTANNKLYVYSGGAWKASAAFA